VHTRYRPSLWRPVQDKRPSCQYFGDGRREHHSTWLIWQCQHFLEQFEVVRQFLIPARGDVVFSPLVGHELIRIIGRVAGIDRREIMRDESAKMSVECRNHPASECFIPLPRGLGLVGEGIHEFFWAAYQTGNVFLHVRCIFHIEISLIVS
jgi:hypothetical protein